MGALQALQWRRCGKRRAKINESLYYKMPKCVAQSMYVLAQGGGTAATAAALTATTKLRKKE